MTNEKPVYDDKNYSVVTATGERKNNLTREQAVAFARKRDQQWREIGRIVRIQVFFCTGKEIPWQEQEEDRQ